MKASLSLSTFITIGIIISSSLQNAAADNNDNDDRRLLDPLCRRARSLVDWGESFNNRGEESSNPLWKAIEQRCCEPVTVRNDEHMICNTFLCIRIYIYIYTSSSLYRYH